MEEDEDFGIDNVQIENFIIKSGDNVSKNFVGLFPADKKKKQVQRYKCRNQEQRNKVFIYDCKH